MVGPPGSGKTIADLVVGQSIEVDHISEAIQYRRMIELSVNAGS
jgi:predicted ATPase with chaperone activity